jgi:hypothetical protein
MNAIMTRNFLNNQMPSSQEDRCTILLLLKSVPQIFVITSGGHSEWEILVCFSFVTKLWVEKVKMI